MPKAITPASNPTVATPIRWSPFPAAAPQIIPLPVLVVGTDSGRNPGPSATRSWNALQAGEVRVHNPVLPSWAYTMYVPPSLNSYPHDISLNSVSMTVVSRRGPFQTRLTLKSTATGSADDMRNGG